MPTRALTVHSTVKLMELPNEPAEGDMICRAGAVASIHMVISVELLLPARSRAVTTIVWGPSIRSVICLLRTSPGRSVQEPPASSRKWSIPSWSAATHLTSMLLAAYQPPSGDTMVTEGAVVSTVNSNVVLV